MPQHMKGVEENAANTSRNVFIHVHSHTFVVELNLQIQTMPLTHVFSPFLDGIYVTIEHTFQIHQPAISLCLLGG